MLLRDDPYGVTLKIRKWGGWEGTCDSTQLYLLGFLRTEVTNASTILKGIN